MDRLYLLFGWLMLICQVVVLVIAGMWPSGRGKGFFVTFAVLGLLASLTFRIQELFFRFGLGDEMSVAQVRALFSGTRFLLSLAAQAMLIAFAIAWLGQSQPRPMPPMYGGPMGGPPPGMPPTWPGRP